MKMTFELEDSDYMILKNSLRLTNPCVSCGQDPQFCCGCRAYSDYISERNNLKEVRLLDTVLLIQKIRQLQKIVKDTEKEIDKKKEELLSGGFSFEDFEKHGINI